MRRPTCEGEDRGATPGLATGNHIMPAGDKDMVGDEHQIFPNLQVSDQHFGCPRMKGQLKKGAYILYGRGSGKILEHKGGLTVLHKTDKSRRRN